MLKQKKLDFIVKPYTPSKIYDNNMVCINLQKPHTATHDKSFRPCLNPFPFNKFDAAWKTSSNKHSSHLIVGFLASVLQKRKLNITPIYKRGGWP